MSLILDCAGNSLAFDRSAQIATKISLDSFSRLRQKPAFFEVPNESRCDHLIQVHLDDFRVNPGDDFLDDFPSYRIGHDFDSGHERENLIRGLRVFGSGEAKIFAQDSHDVRFRARLVNQYHRVNQTFE